MTVQELIDKLNSFPPDYQVFVETGFPGSFNGIGNVVQGDRVLLNRDNDRKSKHYVYLEME